MEDYARARCQLQEAMEQTLALLVHHGGELGAGGSCARGGGGAGVRGAKRQGVGCCLRMS